MATKNQKLSIEVLLVGAEIGGIKLQPHLVKTTRLVTVDMICPRAAIAKKTAAKEVKFQKAQAGVRAIVSLGSNIEPRADYLQKALAALSALPGTTFVRASSVLETEPVDVPAEFSALKFLNQVVLFETTLDPFEFSCRMHAIEEDLGRVRTVRNGPRTIDIDLIDFGGMVIDTPELTLPHPRAGERVFVLKPLAELGIVLEVLKS